MYPDEHFIEKPVKEAMESFRKRLAEVSSAIKIRNEGKKLPYYYFSPDRIPNSVAVWERDGGGWEEGWERGTEGEGDIVNSDLWCCFLHTVL